MSRAPLPKQEPCVAHTPKGEFTNEDYQAEPCEKTNQPESVTDVTTIPSCDEAGSSLDDNDLRDVELADPEPLYTVFTAGQKRFIVSIAACAGFFSAVSSCSFWAFSIPTLLTRGPDLGKHIFSSSELSHR
jgi:hypothetical protein